MNGFLEGKTTASNLAVKQFGYLLSALFLLISVTGMVLEWLYTPWLALITMYFLTGSLWIPSLIKPFYTIIGRYIIKPDSNKNEHIDDSDNGRLHKNK